MIDSDLNIAVKTTVKASKNLLSTAFPGAPITQVFSLFLTQWSWKTNFNLLFSLLPLSAQNNSSGGRVHLSSMISTLKWCMDLASAVNLM